MYFTNINNDELKHFKDTKIPFNFIMSLTGILREKHPLFHVEDIGNNIYRICPLFRCKEILSSNEEDKVFDTSCIITIQKTKETYYLFKNNEDDDTYSYSSGSIHEHYFPNFNINDDLTDADFNRIVYLLRKNRKHYDNIQIKHDTLINSTYGTYLFDLKDSTISDEGIIITPATLENDCTVTLIDPIFHNSKYYLNLNIKSINHINLCTGDDYPITTHTIRIPLIRNTPVNIPFENINLYDIIDFNASVEIIHNEPIMLEESYLNLSVSSNNIDLGESVTLTAVYYNANGSSADKTIVFKNNGNVIGSAVTNAYGQAILNYTPDTRGNCSIIADYDNTIISSAVSVEVTKLTSTLLLEANTDSALYGMSINISGSLKYHDTGLNNKSIKIYDGATLLTTLTTDVTGAFTGSVTGTGLDMSLKAVFEGDNNYLNVDSSIVSVRGIKLGTTLTISVPNSLEYSDDFNITGTLMDVDNNAVSNVEVGLKVGNAIVDTQMTNQNGEVSFTHTPVSIGTHTFQLIYLGGNIYEASYSTVIQKDINKETTILTLTAPSTTSTVIGSPQSITITGTLQDNDPSPIANASVLVKENNTIITSFTTGNDGSFTGTINGSELGGGIHNLKIIYPENQGYTESYVERTIVVIEDISLTATKDILSYADNDETILTAQLRANGFNFAVEGILIVFKFYKDGEECLSPVSVQTNDLGMAQLRYSSRGVGDVSIKAECMSLIQTYGIQDCSYYNPTEQSMSVKNNHMLYDTNMAVQLSTNAEISFDINIPSNNDYDYRYWILPKSQFNGMNYPPYAFWFHKKSSRVECNEMLNGNYRYSSVKIQSTKTNEYVTMKYVKNGTEISAYVDDTLIYTNTCEWIDNYTDYCISLMKWTGDKTMLIKNVKVKPL